MLPSRTEWKLPFLPLDRRIMDARLLVRLSEPDFLRPGIMGPTGGWPERRVTVGQPSLRMYAKELIALSRTAPWYKGRYGDETYIR